VRNLKRYQWMWLWIALVWPFSAWALGSALADEVSSLSLSAALICAFLALIGGLASTLQKLADGTEQRGSVRLEILRDMVTSLVAGIATFLALEYFKSDAILEAGAILIAGYGGSRVLSRYLDRFMQAVDRGADTPK
jgi:uncharacterized membrane protein